MRLREIKRRLQNISESATLENKLITTSFIAWWSGKYPKEYEKSALEVKANKNLKKNAILLLERMKEWKEGLRYNV